MLVLQLNIWARYGPYRDREPRLRRLFEELRPDLIGMQEVDLGRTGENQAAELLDGLDLRRFPRGHDWGYTEEHRAAVRPEPTGRRA